MTTKTQQRGTNVYIASMIITVGSHDCAMSVILIDSTIPCFFVMRIY